MRRSSLLLAVVVSLLSVSEAFAVCRTDVTWGFNVSTLKSFVDPADGFTKPIANDNLFDYGIIFEDANDPTCAGTAAVALYKKVKATADLPVYWDGNVRANVDAYEGWLEGANLGLVYASALRLGGNGKLTKPLAALIDSVLYNAKIDAYCGFASNRFGQTGSTVWTKGNSCMDDWAMIAHARGWQAAWKQNYTGYATPYVSAAKSAIWNALNTSESICLHKHSASPANPAPSAGPCTATASEVASGAAVALGLHNGDAMPYGLGLMTGVGSGHVGLDSIGQSVSFTANELTIAKSLYKNADFHTEWDSTYQYSFKGDCFIFSLGTSGQLVRNTNFGCYEPGYGNGKPNGYQPEMFPVKDYYDSKLGGSPVTLNYNYSTFQDSLFCDTPGTCNFFSPGRKAVYKTLGSTWVWSRPTLNATTSDYTSTFKAYDNAHYLSARNGGGSDVNAEPTTIGNNERFSMIDVNGGTLVSGDYVYLMVANGKYVSATNGGGSDLKAVNDTPLTWERFTIQKMNGTGQIYTGDTVALKVLNGQYISAVNGGGSNTVALYTSAITWEVFTLNFTR
jgi:hypothetical protein